jgi:stage II sporulation protein M
MMNELKTKSDSDSTDFKGAINFDSAFGISSAAAPPSSPLSPFHQSLKRASSPLFWTFFLYISFIFIIYIVFFAFTMFTALNPYFLSGVLSAAHALPAPISAVLSFAAAYHISIAAALAFLNFAVSFADFYLSGKSIRNHLTGLLSSAFKSTLWMTVLFTVSLAIGYATGYLNPGLFEYLLGSFVLPERDAFGIMLHIFFNNTRIAFMLVFMGFVLGLLPVAIIFINGLIVGVVSEHILRNESVAFLLTGLAPHGIIEIPVILLTAGIGYASGFLASNTLFGRKNLADFKQHFIGAAWIFFLIVVPLLFIAAVIEVYVTAPLLGVVF